MNAYANHFAERFSVESEMEPRIELAFRIALGRSPRSNELSQARQFLADSSDVAAFCQALFASAEFRYVD